MNWGIRITILYISFVLLIVVLVSLSMNQKVDLVSSDYYEKELKFQDKIDGANNFNQLNAPISLKAKQKLIEINFPTEFAAKSIKGNVWVYRPSDASLDIKDSISINASGQQNIFSEKLKRGLYKVQLEWTMDGKKYFNEQDLFMN